MINAFRLKNNHDHIHISHDMTKEEDKVNKETMIHHQKALCSR